MISILDLPSSSSIFTSGVLTRFEVLTITSLDCFTALFLRFNSFFEFIKIFDFYKSTSNLGYVSTLSFLSDDVFFGFGSIAFSVIKSFLTESNKLSLSS